MLRSLARCLRWTALPILVAACGDVVCVAVPCPLPGPAFLLTIKSSVTGAVVVGASVRVDGVGDPMPCVARSLSACDVRVDLGTHQLEVGAPGFRTSRLTLEARGTMPECGCAIFDTQPVEVMLVPE